MDDSSQRWTNALARTSFPTPAGWMPGNALAAGARAMVGPVADTLGAPVDALTWFLRRHGISANHPIFNSVDLRQRLNAILAPTDQP